ncbi:MAG: 16S rRNA (uracil(1498)-N(3))-methyltransferase [Desulfobacterales bacterium]|nr:16S rRNA (uracil(1498)-N(3))-methyltransferase [Deltaproteobacteria bacterium]NNK92724.1 16S rRNA (uracil(1498)-N(3))-methyltransferase [Desulfobacterales bacterium]
MNRFFFEPAGDASSTVTLDKEESHHLANVLRLPVGMEVELFDGTGNLYAGRIKTTGKRVTVRLLERVVSDSGKKTALWVYQGDLKGKKMDLVVQKCTELGVDYFVPFTSGRSQGRLERERWERKNERWEKIIKSACKQSGRLRFMEVMEKQTLEHISAFARETEPARKILFWENEPARRLSDFDWHFPEHRICLMLGTEGGFSVQEAKAAQSHGWQVVSLGRQILRAETATIAAVSIVQYLLES